MLKIFHLSLTIFIVLSITDCGLQKPGVNPAFVEPRADHGRFTDPCSSCHEDTRPKTNDNVVHGYGRDCGECHRFSLQTFWRPFPVFSHNPPPTDCLACHATKRPQTETHPPRGDCFSCHRFPDWKAIIGGS